MESKGRARKIIGVAHHIVNLGAVTIIIIALGIGFYALSDIGQVIINGSPVQYAKYKPGENKLSFDQLRVINPDVFGWIEVYGTKIDYPVLQGEDNKKYVSHNAEGDYSLLGAIFLDCNNP